MQATFNLCLTCEESDCKIKKGKMLLVENALPAFILAANVMFYPSFANAQVLQ